MEESECVKQGPEGRVWKFVHHEDFNYQTDLLKGRECDYTWLKITPDGTLTVKGSHGKGYAWDGCTPKWNSIHITWGNFDGQLYRHAAGDYKPFTYYASMVHDVIYQYKRCAPITRKEADIIFLDLLRKTRFMHSKTFYLGVRLFGGWFGKWPFDPNAETDDIKPETKGQG